MTEDQTVPPSPPPWEPHQLHTEIRKWIEFFTNPPPPTEEELKDASEIGERLRAMVKERFPEMTLDLDRADVPAPSSPPEPPVTVGRVLDALDRVALDTLSDELTDPLILAGVLRLLDGATELRAQLGIERRAVVELGPTTLQVAGDVLDVVMANSMAAPSPRWAREIARSLARSKASHEARTCGEPSTPPTQSVGALTPPADELTRYLNIVRGFEVGALEAFLDADTAGDTGPTVLAGLAGAAKLRRLAGLTRDDEDALRRKAPKRTPVADEGPPTRS